MSEWKRWVAAGLAVLAGCDERDKPAQRTSHMPGHRAIPVAAPLGATPVARLVPPVAPSAAAAPITPPIVRPELPPTRAFPPKDECAALPDFPLFRGKLEAAVAARDAEGLVALADAAVRLDFGGGAGSEELKKRLADPDLTLWEELDAVLPLGCAADGSIATMPWIFSRMPDGIDPYRGMLVVGDAVPLRRRAAAGAPESQRLGWTIVTLAGDEFNAKARFAEVIAPGGVHGFVESAKLRSLIGYRVIADHVDGAWKITAFVTGD